MNPILIEIGNIKIYWYSIMILIGFLIASYLITKESKKFNISKEKITDMLFYTIIIGILGARLYYVLFNLNYYSKNILDITPHNTTKKVINFLDLFFVTILKKVFKNPDL